MKQLYLLVLLSLPVFCFSQAPGIKWLKSFGGSKIDKAQAICKTPFGGYIVAGYAISKNGDVTTHNHADDAGDCWLLNVNADGTILWQKSYGGHSTDEVNAIEPTKDSGYIFIGYSSSFDSITNPKGALDYWVVKIDKNGNKQWERAYGGTDYDYGQDIKPTADGGYILAGTVLSNNKDVAGTHGGYDGWIVKIDSAGNIQWKKCYGSTGTDRIYKIEVLPGGGYAFVGYSDSKIAGNHGANDVWVGKIDSVGNSVWQKCLGGTESDFALSFKAIPQGGYIIAASSTSEDGDVKGGTHAANQDFWMVKLDDKASVIWQKQYGGSADDVLTDVIVAEDNAYVFCGYTESDLLKVDPLRKPPNAWFYKCDSAGITVWEKIVGGNGADYPYALTGDTSSIVFAGASYSNNADITGNHGDYDFIAGKLEAASLPLSFLSFTGEKQQLNVLLHWQTASEINTKAFNIQRSTDGQHFSTAGTKPASGTGNGIMAYSYTDVNAMAKTGSLYYRLQEEDKDGSLHYSKTIHISNGGDEGVAIMPNPVTSTIRVRLQAGAGKAVVHLADMGGKTVFASAVTIQGGFLQIPAARLAPGTYMLNIQVNGTAYTLRVIKQ